MASIAPQGPRSMAARDEWLRIDFHLIDNLVNLFAESQVGPEREPRGSPRWGRGSLGGGDRQGAAEAGQPWEGGGRSRAHPAPAPPTVPQQPLPCLGTHIRECVFKASCPVGMASLVWSGSPRRGVAGSTDHRGGLKSPGWDLLPAQPISCITRVLPPGHSDPQLLFGQVEPLEPVHPATVPSPHRCVRPSPPAVAPSLSLPQPPSRCWDTPRSSHLRTSAVGALQLERPPTPGLHTGPIRPPCTPGQASLG